MAQKLSIKRFNQLRQLVILILCFNIISCSSPEEPKSKTDVFPNTLTFDGVEFKIVTYLFSTNFFGDCELYDCSLMLNIYAENTEAQKRLRISILIDDNNLTESKLFNGEYRVYLYGGQTKILHFISIGILDNTNNWLADNFHILQKTDLINLTNQGHYPRLIIKKNNKGEITIDIYDIVTLEGEPLKGNIKTTGTFIGL